MREKKETRRDEQKNEMETKSGSVDYRRGREAAFGLNGARVDVPCGLAALEAAAEAGNVDAQAEAAELIFVGGLGRKPNPRRAVELAATAATAGNPFALRTTGIAYREGRGVPRDEAEAEARFRRAVDGFRARPNDVRAWTGLALCLVEGRGVERSFEEAVRLLRKATDAGSVEAKTGLAWRYYFGEGVEKNVDEAKRLFREAAVAGASDAAFASAELSALDERGANGRDAEGKRAETTRMFRRAANLGSVEGAERLAKRLFRGVGGERDVEEAIFWFRRAAESGSVEAAKRLALDCEIDGEERVAWLNEAIETNEDPEALCELGTRWSTGVDVPWSSEAEATRLLNRAVELKWGPAMRRLAEIIFEDYDDEEKTERFLDFDALWNADAEASDVDAAIAWLERAVAWGDGEAANRLGLIYQYGNYGVEADATVSARWFEIGGEFGCGKAANSAGVAYLEGKGVKRNEKKAVAYFELAFRLRDADGANNWGLARQDGWGGTKSDEAEAERLFRKALEWGSKTAALNLGTLLANEKDRERRREGRRFLERARETGVEDATYWLAISYLRWENEKADVERGIELLREAAAEGSEAAAFELKRRKLSDDD